MTAEAPADTGGGRVRRRARRTPLAVLGIYLGLAAAAAEDDGDARFARPV